MIKEPTSLKDVSQRLRITREVYNKKQGDFALEASIAHNTYNQYESGKRIPSIDNAILLCQKYDLTLDWIYRGETSGLKYSLAEEIMKKMNEA